MKVVLQRAEVNEREITLEVYALTETALPGKVCAEGEVVGMRPDWLPGLVPQSVLRDKSGVRLPCLVRRARKETRTRIAYGMEQTATFWRNMLDEGTARNRSDLARHVGVSRARVTRTLGPIL